jgi:hypothetical protein
VTLHLTPSHAALGRSTHRLNFAHLIAITWLIIVVQLLLQSWAVTGRTLGDSDDAMRLVELREFLAGRGWFDLHETRVQPPIGYDTHWSRLIDAGLAALFLVFRWSWDVVEAERLTRVVWPLLWLVPAIAGAVAIAWRLAGRQAAATTLILLGLGLPAFEQFRPGRIDHHNVQIALSLSVLAAALWSDRTRGMAWLAGALSGLALAIGFECAPFVAIAGGAFALRYTADRNAAPALSLYGISVAASTVVAFLVSVAPSRWGQMACDAIAINSVAPVVICGLVLAAVARSGRDRRLAVRCIATIGALGAASVASLWLEPRCIAGPYAMIDPAVWPVWHSHVREIQSLAAIFREYPVAAAAIAAYPLAAALAAAVLATAAPARRDTAFIVATGAFAVAAVMTMAAIRASSYAIWLGMPLVAAALLHLFGRFGINTLSGRTLATALLAPAVVASGAIAIAETAGQPSIGERANIACFSSDNYAAMASRPAGLVAADVDYGSFVLALTPHSVLAAPYHRISSGILASHDALASPPDIARDVLLKAGVDYVMLCGERPPEGLTDADRRRSLWGQLKAGMMPDWLELEPDGGVVRLYRVRR